MKTTELRQKDVAGLKVEVKELQKAHFGMRMQKATQQLNNTASLRKSREAVASGAAMAKLSQFVAMTNKFRPAT